MPRLIETWSEFRAELDRLLGRSCAADYDLHRVHSDFSLFEQSVAPTAEDQADMIACLRFEWVFSLLTLDTDESEWNSILDTVWHHRFADPWTAYQVFLVLGYHLARRSHVRAPAAADRCGEALERKFGASVPAGIVREYEDMRSRAHRVDEE